MIVFVLLVASAVAAALVLFEMIGTDLMPWSCPSCHEGSDRTIAGTRYTWYKAYAEGHVYCRYCYTRFKEHPNGTLVVDKD